MPSIRSQAAYMFFSAALFGVIGFLFLTWDHQYTVEVGPDGQPYVLHMVVALKWALQGGAVAFAIAGVLALLNRPISLFLYSLTGLATALVFVSVAIWEYTTPYFSGIQWPILLIFAAWNGYTSVGGLRDAMSILRARDVVQPRPVDS